MLNGLGINIPTYEDYRYYKQNVEEFTRRHTVLTSGLELGKSVLQEARYNLIGDYTAYDIAARIAASVNPLLAAVVPQQEQIHNILYKLKENYEVQQTYLENQTDLLKQDVDLQAESVSKLDDIEKSLESQLEVKPVTKTKQEFNLEDKVVESLDNLEKALPDDAIQQKRQIEQISKLDEIKTTLSDKLDELNKTLGSSVETSQPEFRNKDLKDVLVAIHSELQSIRSVEEGLSSFFTGGGGGQFSFEGAIDRLFNKYNVLLNKHPALRVLHVLGSTLAKIKLGITKPSNIKNILASSIKRFLGIAEEGPLQQIATTNALQVQLQTDILKLLQKKFYNKIEVPEDVESYLNPPESQIDTKLDKLLQPVENFVQDISKLLRTKIQENVPDYETLTSIYKNLKPIEVSNKAILSSIMRMSFLIL